MATSGLHSWYQNLPSWLQSARPFSDTEGSRVTSLGSASTRTKRVSRADAMRCLEGRKSSGTTVTSAATSRFADDESGATDDEADEENDDPWTDPWERRDFAAAGGERNSRWSSSSTYSDAPGLQNRMHELRRPSTQSRSPREDPSMSSGRLNIRHKDCIPAWTIDSSKTAAMSQSSGDGEFIESPAATPGTGTLGAKVQKALRVSSEGEYSSSSQASMPMRPPRVYQIPLEKLFLPPRAASDRPSWIQSSEGDGSDQISKYEAHKNWRRASRAYDPKLRGGGGSIEARAIEYGVNSGISPAWGKHDDKTAEQLLGWRSSSEVSSPTAPEDIYNVRRRNALPAYASFESKLVTKSTSKSTDLTNFDSNGCGIESRKTAWLQAILCALVAFNCWGMALTFGLFQDFYSRTYISNSSPSQISWIGSVQIAMIFGLAVPIGRLAERVSFRVLFDVGVLFLVMGTFAASWCDELAELWAVQGLVAGIGMGTCSAAATVALDSWFIDQHLPLAKSLVAGGGCFGGIVYVLIARALLVGSGFATTMRVLAGVMLATMTPPMILLRMRERASHDLASTTFSDWTAPRGLKSSLPKVTALKDPVYILTAAGMFLVFLGMYFGLVYVVPYAAGIMRLENTASSNLLIFMLTSSILGHLILGLISKRQFAPLKSIVPLVLLNSTVVWLWAAGGNERACVTVAACTCGFLAAGVQVFMVPVIDQHCWEPVSELDKALYEAGSRDAVLAVEKHGLKAGGLYSCIALACLVATPIGGALVELRREHDSAPLYLGAQAFAGAMLLGGGFLLLGSQMVGSTCRERRICT